MKHIPSTAVFLYVSLFCFSVIKGSSASDNPPLYDAIQPVNAYQTLPEKKQEFLLSYLFHKDITPTEMMKLFIEYPEIVLSIKNGRDGNSHFLHHACASGKLDLLELLLRVNVDPNITDPNGKSPLHFCVKSKREDSSIAELLLLKEADINALDGKGQTALDYICPKEKLAKIIVKHGGERNNKDTHSQCSDGSNLLSCLLDRKHS